MVQLNRRDTIRDTFCQAVLRGSGLEIGAGAYPQTLPKGAHASYYDIRNEAETRELFGSSVVTARHVDVIPADFPNGADFLIARNVLEHCSDPIGTLIAWNGSVRDGGTVVISLPMPIIATTPVGGSHRDTLHRTPVVAKHWPRLPFARTHRLIHARLVPRVLPLPQDRDRPRVLRPCSEGAALRRPRRPLARDRHRSRPFDRVRIGRVRDPNGIDREALVA